MKLTAVYEPAKKGGYACFVEAKANLADALKLALQCQRELASQAETGSW